MSLETISADVEEEVKKELVSRADSQKRSIQKQLEWDLRNHPDYEVKPENEQ